MDVTYPYSSDSDKTSGSHFAPSDERIGTFDAPFAATSLELLTSCGSFNKNLALLDLYSGCGGMSTGLCFGAKLASTNLVTVGYGFFKIPFDCVYLSVVACYSFFHLF